MLYKRISLCFVSLENRFLKASTLMRPEIEAANTVPCACAISKCIALNFDPFFDSILIPQYQGKVYLPAGTSKNRAFMKILHLLSK